MQRSGGKIVTQVATVLVTLAVVVLSVMWLSNFFGRKIPADSPPVQAGNPSPPGTSPPPAELFTVQLENVPQYRPVVGTVQAVHATEIGSRLMAQVKAVHVIANQKVKQDEVLVELDDEDLQARVLQAEAALAQAQATAEQAKRDFDKQAQLYKGGASSEQEYRRYETGLKEAQAALARAQQALNQERTNLSWAVIRSPIDGTVVDKLVDRGDMVRPGQPLVRIFNQDKMQLVASVPEQLASSLRPGQEVAVKLDVLPHACAGTVSEVVPEAATESRTFRVKVTGPCPPGVYPGMFGRLLIPIGEVQQAWIPISAVRTYGQLQQVMVVSETGRQRRFVTLGERAGDRVLVLSGLRPGERILQSYGQQELASAVL